MDKNIKISVIIPVYNTEEYLNTCLNSLAQQSFQDIEFICVDDGSTDGSLKILNQFKEKDSRFVVISQKNGGPANARNTGLKHAKGEYVTFVDSDDYIAANAYQMLYKLASKKNADILVFGGVPQPNDAPQWIIDTLSPKNKEYNEFSLKILFEERGARPFLWLQMVKNSILKDNNLLIDESLDLGEDQLFQMAYFPYANKIVFTSEKYYNYRWYRNNSLMHNYNENLLKKLKAHILLVDKAFKLADNFPFSDEYKCRLLEWCTYLFFYDLHGKLTKFQTPIAVQLKQVLIDNGYEKYVSSLDIWTKSRLEQIFLMADGGDDYEAKILAYKKANEELDKKIEDFKQTKCYKKALKKHNSLFRKFKKCLKENGWKYTFRKIIEVLKGNRTINEL